jgi:hypothetical protein
LGYGAAILQASGIMEHVEFVEIRNDSEFNESEEPIADVLATSAEEGAAWTLKYPGFSVVRPEGDQAKTPLYYFVAEPSQFRYFVDGWLKLKMRNGAIKQLYDYWILGQEAEASSPRWCILRDVLHWVD